MLKAKNFTLHDNGVLEVKDNWTEEDQEKLVEELRDQSDTLDPDLPVCCKENLKYGRPSCCVKDDKVN